MQVIIILSWSLGSAVFFNRSDGHRCGSLNSAQE